MKRKPRGKKEDGFEQWGGYMAAKVAKLQEQFVDSVVTESSSESNIFAGVAIFVNGYTVPSADELKRIMMTHGGTYHHYQTDKTTHIIASNLPNCKVKRLKVLNVVKPDWIVDSVKSGKLLDYRMYLLYSNQNKTQPVLNFQPLSMPSNNHASDSTEDHIDEFVKDDTSDNSSEYPDHTLDDDKHDFPNRNTTDTSELLQPVSENVQFNVKNTARSAINPNFLSEFYNNSRLHHISTMGAMFKEYVNKLRVERKEIPFTGIEKLKQLKRSINRQYLENDSDSNDDDDDDRLERCVGNTISKKDKDGEKVIMHIDMDCFFVSVGLRNKPDLIGQPVAVTHAKGNPSHCREGTDLNKERQFYRERRKRLQNKESLDHLLDISEKQDTSHSSDDQDMPENISLSEIASCSYEARNAGVRNGMFLGEALKRCPNLKTIPYDFEGYKEVSLSLYNTIASYTLEIEAVSCDEMYVDCTDILHQTGLTPLEFASHIRDEIKVKTGCTASTGFGANRLQARLATKKAKPNGQFHLKLADVSDFMLDIAIEDLPGVGYSLAHRLHSMGVKTCGDLQRLSSSEIQKEFGQRTGEHLYLQCRGKDFKELEVSHKRKSVSAEVNYGIRFIEQQQAEEFLRRLSEEVEYRLKEIGTRGKKITLKLLVRAKGAPVETAKFMGHGVCDHITRSSTLVAYTDEAKIIAREAINLERKLNLSPEELRGIGIQISTLQFSNEKSNTGNLLSFLNKNKDGIPSSSAQLCAESRLKQDCERNTIESPNAKSKLCSSKKHGSSDLDDSTVKASSNQGRVQDKTEMNNITFSQIDASFISALPQDIVEELKSNLSYKINEIKTAQISNQMNSSTKFTATTHHKESHVPVCVKEPLRKTNRKAITETSESTDSSPHSEATSVFDLCNSVDEVRAVLKEWTRSENLPKKLDMQLLAEYFCALVERKDVQILDVLIKCLHRCVVKKNSTTWQEAYFSIINSMQKQMISVYKVKLKVPKEF